MVTPNRKIILLLLPNRNFVAVGNQKVNIWNAGYLICDPKGVTNRKLRTTVLEHKKGPENSVLKSRQGASTNNLIWAFLCPSMAMLWLLGSLDPVKLTLCGWLSYIAFDDIPPQETKAILLTITLWLAIVQSSSHSRLWLEMLSSPIFFILPKGFLLGTLKGSTAQETK